MTYRIGIDTGGTFTDVVLVDDATGEVHIFKLPSTPSAPAQAFLAGVDRALHDLGLPGSLPLAEGGLGRGSAFPTGIPGRGVAAFDVHVAHGTTVATNALIERKAARTALLVTRGFRDILEIAHQTRPDLFDLFADKPPPLVPRNLCLEIGERLGPEGEVLTPLDEDDVTRAIAVLQAEGVEAVAICFLHAYRFPRHEQRVGALVRASCPDLALSLSSDVLPELREYRRASTTVINAALQPVMRGYLDEVGRGLETRGLDPVFHMMQSSGGVLTSTVAVEKPVYVVESGPAAGVIAATEIARRAGFRDIISLDMGGTTAKASLVRHGRPGVAPEYEVGARATVARGVARGQGYPVGTPVLDLVEIGAGGGSIAWIDAGGMLRVGPRSAGATPGPACYGLGGVDPTVTDANLLLGRLDPATFLGGAMVLDRDAAHQAMTHIAEPLGLSVVEAAAGVVEIANASMVAAVHLVSTQRGIDPRELVLIPFGGAGPLHANALIAELQIPMALIPRSPGVTSALGLLLADLAHDYARTHVQPFASIALDALNAQLVAFREQGRAALESDGVPSTQMEFLPTLDLRYVGQSYELRIPMPLADDGDGPLLGPAAMALVPARFHAEHERAYGHAAPAEPIELVTVRLTAVGRTAKPSWPVLAAQKEPISAAVRTVRPVFFAPAGFVDCPIYRRQRLGAGAHILGPAVVEELDSTVVVHPGYTVLVDDWGNLRCSRSA